MRVEWTLEGFDLAAFHNDFGGLASELQLRWRLERMSERRRDRDGRRRRRGETSGAR
jgi:hypothetical protein